MIKNRQQNLNQTDLNNNHVKQIKILRCFLAEFIGTFALLLTGCGAVIVQEQTQVIGHFGVAVVFGLIIFVMIESFGNVSGAHFNPAVTFALALTKRFSWKQIPLYILAQSMGAFTAMTILKFMFPMSKTLGATMPNMHFGSEIISFVIEFLLTFILMLVILQIVMGEKPKDISIGLTIGAVVLLEVMFAGPISGGSLNPIRSLAPAILSGQTTALWVYLLGPTLGAISAVPIWSYINSNRCASMDIDDDSNY